MRYPQFITPECLVQRALETSGKIYDTSTNAPTSRDLGTICMSELSPFTIYRRIPVPGKKNTFSDTVEGIWQGLKIIKGKTDFSYFHGKGRKRLGRPSGHLYKDRRIGLIEARKKIYVPSFEFIWTNRISPAMRQLFVELAFDDVPQYFLDVDSNSDINNPISAYAHSALIVELIKRDIDCDAKNHPI